MAKRLFDLFLSSLGLIVLSPLFFIISIWIKLDSKGDVFFLGERVGRGGRSFRIIKFRSMSQDAPSIGPELTAGEDKRITRAGRFLRKAKLDELPQLLNVLKGEMSLVGPRPEVQRYVNQFPEDYAEILEIRPGITDIASLEFRNEAVLLGQARDPESEYLNIILPEKIRLAKEYKRRSSVWYDLKLISRTIKTLASQSRLLDTIALATLILIMAVAVLYPDSFISGGPGTGALRFSPLSILSPMVILVGVIFIVKRRASIQTGLVDFVLFGFIGYFLVRNITGGLFPGTIKYAAYILVIYYLCLLLSQKPAYLKAMIYSIVSLTLVSALYGVFVEYMLQQNIIYHSFIIDSVKESSNGTHRIGSTLAHPVAYGAFLVQSIPFCIYLVFNGHSRMDRAFGIAASVMAVMALFFTFTKGSWLVAAIIGLASMAVLIFKKGRGGIILISGLVIFIALMSLLFWNTLSDELSHRTDMSIQLRRIGWTAATEAIKEQPVFGAGFHNAPGESYEQLDDYIRDRIDVLSVDNSYLTLFLEEGIVGLALWLLFICLTLFAGFRAMVNGDAVYRPVATAAFISVLAFCLNAVTFEAMFIWSNLIIFWICAGILRGTGNIRKEALFANINSRA